MRWNWIYVLCLITGWPAMAGGNQGYRVGSRSQTLIQIARDVYKDERLWKEIAYWNGIKPPYALNVGQVLVLKTPGAAVPPENLVTGAELDSIKPLTRWPSVKRKIVKSGDDLIYVVNERAPSLMMIARELYDDAGMAKKISAWGGFEPDARLSLGQRLRLKVPPTKTAAEGTAILIKNWRALDNDLMVERLGGVAAVHERQPAAATKKAKKAKPPCAVPCAAPCGSSQVTNGSVGKSVKGGNSAIVPGPQGFSTSPGPASGSAVSSSSASAENREPQSSAGDDTFVLRKKSDSPDGIPAAHKTENYWLGDEAAHLLEVLQKKLDGR